MPSPAGRRPRPPPPPSPSPLRGASRGRQRPSRTAGGCRAVRPSPVIVLGERLVAELVHRGRPERCRHCVLARPAECPGEQPREDRPHRTSPVAGRVIGRGQGDVEGGNGYSTTGARPTARRSAGKQAANAWRQHGPGDQRREPGDGLGLQPVARRRSTSAARPESSSTWQQTAALAWAA